MGAYLPYNISIGHFDELSQTFRFLSVHEHTSFLRPPAAIVPPLPPPPRATWLDDDEQAADSLPPPHLPSSHRRTPTAVISPWAISGEYGIGDD